MLNLKKVIALVCVFALALTTVAFGATYADVPEDSAYYEAVETLTKLGIVEGDDNGYRPEDGVTRAEMAALIARIQGYGETARPAANTPFTDVPSSHWASGYIANAAGMGIINGYGDGTFGPEDPVLYEQAVKMIMATLGYTPFADKNGGYPTGYLAAAQRYDVSLAVANAAVGQAANRGTVAQLLANAIDTPLMIQAKWNTNGEVEYVIADGKSSTYRTLMSENLGIVKLRGVVVENSTTRIGGEKDIDTDEEAAIRVDVKDAYDTTNKKLRTAWSYDEKEDSWQYGEYGFLVADSDADDFLGQSVIMYVREVNDEFEVISIAADTARSKELVIDLDQYAGNNDGKIKYYKDGASTTSNIVVEAGLKVVFNYDGGYEAYEVEDDEYVADLDGTLAAIDDLVLGDETICPFGGQITFIDNDLDNGYDIAMIEMAGTAVVEEVDDDTALFYDDAVLNVEGDTLAELEVDADDETKIVKITKDGEEIAVTDLVEWDVLSIIAASDNANVIIAEVVTNSVVGTVSSRSKSNSSAVGYAYTVEGTKYDVIENAYGIEDEDALEVGMGGTFYINKYGKLAAFNEDAALATGASSTYAYILGVEEKVQEFGGEGFEVNIQMLTADGVEVATLKKNADIRVEKGNAAANYKVDASTWADENEDEESDGEEFGDLLDDLFIDEEHTTGKVVKYTKTSAGLISTITLPEYDDNFVTKDLNGAGLEYDAEDSEIDGKTIESDAIAFIIDETAKESKFANVADVLEHEEDYTVYASYGKDNGEISIVVFDAATVGAAGNTSGVAVIVSAGTKVNDDNDTVWALEYYYNGELCEADTTADAMDNIDTDELSKGDVVKVKVSGGVITNVGYLWNFADEDLRGADKMTAVDYDGSGYVEGAKEAFAGGVVVTAKKSSNKVTFADADYEYLGEDARIEAGDELKLSTSGANVYVIDETARGINVKASGSYTYFKSLYDDEAAGPITVIEKNNMTYIDVDGTCDEVDEAKAAADHVYVRVYDGDVTDVIIVKGADKIK